MRYFFSDEDLKICSTFANTINTIKSGYKSTRNLNENPHYIGKLGEIIFANQFNLSVNFEVSFSGDCGHDFQLGNLPIDVKTTQYWRYPELKEFVDSKPKSLSIVYVLVRVNLDDSWGELFGFISAKKLNKISPTNYRGLGMRRVADNNHLCKDWDLLLNYANTSKFDTSDAKIFNNAKLV